MRPSVSMLLLWLLSVSAHADTVAYVVPACSHATAISAVVAVGRASGTSAAFALLWRLLAEPNACVLSVVLDDDLKRATVTAETIKVPVYPYDGLSADRVISESNDSHRRPVRREMYLYAPLVSQFTDEH